jgi:hypothetical protein
MKEFVKRQPVQTLIFPPALSVSNDKNIQTFGRNVKNRGAHRERGADPARGMAPDSMDCLTREAERSRAPRSLVLGAGCVFLVLDLGLQVEL